MIGFSYFGGVGGSPSVRLGKGFYVGGKYDCVGGVGVGSTGVGGTGVVEGVTGDGKLFGKF